MTNPNKPQRYSKTLTAQRNRAERAAAVKAARQEREAARAKVTPHRQPLPRPGTAAWRAFAIGAIKAAEEDAKRRKRRRQTMHINHHGHRLAYHATTLGRVIVEVNGAQAAGWYGALWA